MAKKIKEYFPRLPICILADGLYPNNTVFDICRQNNWKFVITLKDGCLKTFHAEVKLLNAMVQKREVHRRNKTDNIKLECKYINDIEYDGHDYNWLWCREHKTRLTDGNIEEQTFVYITNVRLNPQNIVETADGGRLRWKIENEGFNVQKNQGMNSNTNIRESHTLPYAITTIYCK